MLGANTAMDFAEEVSELLQTSGRFRHGTLAKLSDLDMEQRRELRAAWAEGSIERRKQILAGLRDLAEEDVEYNFKQVFLLALDDLDPSVRARAVEGLWEEEALPVLNRLLLLLHSDPAPEVQAAAASVLGRFAYAGAVGALDVDSADRLRLALRATLSSAPEGSELEMRALESLAYFADEPMVARVITRFHAEDDEQQQASALRGMGRTMDARWHPDILQQLDSDSARVRFHASRAAGDAGLTDAVPQLGDLLQDHDLEVRQAAIWALGQIGTPEATRRLKAVAQDTDDTLSSHAEDALAEAVYAVGNE